MSDSTSRTQLFLAAGFGTLVGAGVLWLLTMMGVTSPRLALVSHDSVQSAGLQVKDKRDDGDVINSAANRNTATLDVMQNQLQRFETQLATTTEQLQRLSGEVHLLTQQADSSTSSLTSTEDSFPDDPENDVDALRAAHSEQRFPTVVRQTRQQRLNSLQTAGLDQQSAIALLTRQDEQRLAELELTDRAAREEWLDSDEFRVAFDELQAQSPDLRTELGTDAYDRYLFANGQPNRVRISEVISGSAAEINGIQSDDVIITYAENRIFTLDELQQATRSGNRGEPVTVVILRDQQLMEVVVERGPLGVQLTLDRQSPDL